MIAQAEGKAKASKRGAEEEAGGGKGKRARVDDDE